MKVEMTERQEGNGQQTEKKGDSCNGTEDGQWRDGLTSVIYGYEMSSSADDHK